MTGMSYRQLEVWRMAMDLVEEVYRVSRQLSDEERYGLRSQMRRSAVSLPSNIAEGYGRQHRNEYVQFLYVARGSLMELETQLTLCVRLKLVDRQAVEPLWQTAQRVGQMLNKLIESLKA